MLKMSISTTVIQLAFVLLLVCLGSTTTTNGDPHSNLPIHAALKDIYDIVGRNDLFTQVLSDGHNLQRSLFNYANFHKSQPHRRKRDLNEKPVKIGQPLISASVLDLSGKNLTALTNLSNLIASSESGDYSATTTVLLVNLSRNAITVFNTSNLDNILNLINASNSKSLQLDLSNNQIEIFNLSVLNQLTKLNSESLKSLIHLDLSKNRFNDSRHIVLHNLTQLNYLDVSCNLLSDIDRNLFLNATNLIKLDLSHNLLLSLHKDSFYRLEHLEVLDLSHNDISDIENDTFTKLPLLQYLDLSFNNVHVTSVRALQGIPDLIGLSIANNELLNGNSLQGFVVSWSVNELDVSNIGLCQVPFALAQSVRILNLQGNHLNIIQSGDLESYPLLHKLILTSNQLVEIEEDALGRLEMLSILYLDHNNLTSFPTSLPSNLIKLYLQNNKITEIQPSNLADLICLEVLDLSHNQILYLPPLPLRKLLSLNLKSCGLKGINQLLVQSSPNLRELNLENNPLKCTDLLGIAEWATPCREDVKIFDPPFSSENDDDEFSLDEMNNNNNDRKEKILNSKSYFSASKKSNQVRNCNNCHKKSHHDIIIKKLPNCVNEQQKLITSLKHTNGGGKANANDNKLRQSIISSAMKRIVNGMNDTHLSAITKDTSNNDGERAGNISGIVENVLNETFTQNPIGNETSNKNWTNKNDYKISLNTSTFSPKYQDITTPETLQKLDKLEILHKEKQPDSIPKQFKESSVDSITAIPPNSENVSVKSFKDKATAKKSLKLANYSSGNKRPIKPEASRKKEIWHYKSAEHPKGLADMASLTNFKIFDYANSKVDTKVKPSEKLNLFNSQNAYDDIRKGAGNYKSSFQLNKTNKLIENYYQNSPANNESSKPVDNLDKINNEPRSSRNENLQVQSAKLHAQNYGTIGVDDSTTTSSEYELNHTVENPEQWNDLRTMDDVNSHPGLLVVVGVAIGVLLTFMIVNMYRCNCKRKVNRSNNTTLSTEDILTDEVNEELFTINHLTSSGQQRDLLPMDVLNSTLSQTVDNPNVSLTDW